MQNAQLCHILFISQPIIEDINSVSVLANYIIVKMAEQVEKN